MKRSFLGSQSSLLKVRPLVVGTLTASLPIPAQLKAARSAFVDLIELRLDGFAGARGAFQKAQEFGRNLIREIKTKTKLPILLTFRAASESGVKSQGINDAHRAEILARLLPSVDLVDVEIRRSEFARRMTVIAHIHGVDAIHSAHDFKTPGRFSELWELSKRSNKLKGDLFKVAVTPKTNDDTEKFLEWGLSLKNPGKIMIAMGAAGLPSRIVGFSFGSQFTYGHLGNSAAPGQLPARDLVRAIKDVYPAL